MMNVFSQHTVETWQFSFSVVFGLIWSKSHRFKRPLIFNMTGTPQDPKWSLERRESSGHLVWRKESPSSKVRFRFDVEVLEFEKQPHEDIEYRKSGYSGSTITSTIAFCVTCVAAVAVSVFLPWYLMDKALSSGS